MIQVHVYAGTKFPTQSMMAKKLFKTQQGRIPINPAILAAIGHRFIAKFKKIQNADALV